MSTNYISYRHLALHDFNAFSSLTVWRFKTRSGLGMAGRIVAGTTKQILHSAIINPNNAPPCKKWIRQFRTLCLLLNEILSKSREAISHKFYKAMSLRKLRRNETESN